MIKNYELALIGLLASCSISNAMEDGNNQNQPNNTNSWINVAIAAYTKYLL